MAGLPPEVPLRLLPLVVFALACTPPSEDGPTIDDNLGVVETEGQDACDNLDGDGHCLLPFPSDHWRDASTGRLALVEAAMPAITDGTHLSVEAFDEDGFGVASPILFQLRGATTSALPPLFDLDASLAADAPVVLVDAATGARIPCWVEHDWMEGEAEDPIFVIRPGVPLPSGARVVVGVRGLVDADGAAVAAPEGFAALRDGTASHRKGVHARRAHYEADVFPVLEAAGFARADLQLAWDLTTRTEASAQADLADVVAAVYDAIGEDGPAFDVDQIQVVEGDPHLALIVDATAHVPSFLLPEGGNGVRRLRRDAAGHPVAEGFEDVPFRVQVPHSVLDGDEAAPVLQYGHGFLGSRREADNGWLREMADRKGFVILASDMQGMSDANTGPWAQVLLMDAGHMKYLADEPMQGIANHLALQRLMASGMHGDAPAELKRDGGAVVWDPTQLWYHGNSQGGTMGTLVVATSRDVRRGALGVPGCCFPFLLDRSVDFVDWKGVLDLGFTEQGDLTMLLALLGTGWDRLEGLTWVGRLTDPLPGAPTKQVLLHVGLEDAQVMNEASWVLARAVGAVQPAGNAHPVPRIGSVALPAADLPAVVVNFAFGFPADPTPEDPPVDASDTHGMPRKLPAAQDQSVHFLRTGEVIDVCDGGSCLFAPL